MVDNLKLLVPVVESLPQVTLLGSEHLTQPSGQRLTKVLKFRLSHYCNIAYFNLYLHREGYTFASKRVTLDLTHIV